MANFEAFQLSEQQVNARGAKFCPLSVNGEKVQLTFGSKAEPLATLWGPSSFDPSSNTSRCNMDFICDAKMTTNLRALDDWARVYLEKHCQRILGKTLTKDQVADGYMPVLVQTGSYPAQVRCKINLSGSRSVRCWDENGQPRDPPSDWKSCKFVAKVTLSHLWLMSKEMGWVLNLTDLQIFEDARVCPFV